MAIVHLRSIISFRAAGQFAQVVNTWDCTDPTETDAFRLARLLVIGFTDPTAGTAYFESLCGILSEDTFISSAKAQQTAPPGANYIRAYSSSAWPGTFTGNLCAQQVATYIRWNSSGEKGYHGGNFYPGVSADALDANRFTDDFKTAVVAFMDSHIAGITVGGHTFVPTFLRQAPVSAGYKVITSGQISTTPGTQRRRLTPV